MKPIYRENLNFSPTGLPVKIIEMNKNANELGCDFHWHEEIELYYVVKGSLKLNINGKESRVQAGDIGFVSPMALHRGSAFEDSTKHYIVQISLDLLTRLHLQPSLLSSDFLSTLFIHQDQDLNKQLAAIVDAFQNKHPYFELNIIGLTYTLLSVLMQKLRVDNALQSAQPEIITLHQVQNILSYIGDHYREKITLDQLSKELGISKAYMCRIFKKHTHQTINHHINEQKCHYAASLMLDGHHLNDAAFICGFEDYNYFSRVFKKIMGMSPTKYISM